MREVIERLKKLEATASPPDWSVEEGWTPDDERFCHIEGWTDDATHGEWLALKRVDADLIAEVRNALPALFRYIEDLQNRFAYDPRLEPFHPHLRVWIPKRTGCTVHFQGKLYCNPSNPDIRFDEHGQPYLEGECHICETLRCTDCEEAEIDG